MMQRTKTLAMLSVLGATACELPPTDRWRVEGDATSESAAPTDVIAQDNTSPDGARRDDAASDAAPLDATMDSATEAGIEGGMDASVTDSSPDARPDASADASADSQPDSTPDAAPDAMPSCPSPRPLSPLSSSQINRDRPTLRWAPSAMATGYAVELCQSADCASVMTFNTTSASLAVTIAPGAGRLLFWRVAATCGGVRSAFSPVWSVVTGLRTSGPQIVERSAPDFNNDGVEDVVIGAPGSSHAYAYISAAGTVSFDPADRLSIAGPGGAGRFGERVVSAGDMDGDGLPELAVSTTRATGRVFIFSWRRTAFVLVSTQTDSAASTLFGASLASAGDIDGDGYGELLVGAPNANSGAGAVDVVWGGASPVDWTRTRINAPASPAATAEFGASIAAGDANEDGVADLFIGAPGSSTNAGRVFQLFGTRDRAVLSTATTRAFGAPPMGSAAGRFGAELAFVSGSRASASSPTVAGLYVHAPGPAAFAFTYHFVTDPSGGAPTSINSATRADDSLGAGFSGAALIDNNEFGDVLFGVPGASGAMPPSNTGMAVSWLHTGGAVETVASGFTYGTVSAGRFGAALTIHRGLGSLSALSAIVCAPAATPLATCSVYPLGAGASAGAFGARAAVLTGAAGDEFGASITR
ncbi:MAG: FG-GAP-like repeat-containing protein [Polyangiales bacterium]